MEYSQFNANSSSFELLDIDQIEFVRGPQGALYGRNTVGGLVNITSRRPSLKNWTGQLTGPFGNIGYGAIQGTASGPVVTDKLAVGVGIGARDEMDTPSMTSRATIWTSDRPYSAKFRRYGLRLRVGTSVAF